MSHQMELPYPRSVALHEWQAARAALLEREKAATHALDALAAERRKLPMVRLGKTYRLRGPDGERSLADLFDGRSQLIVYHFMFPPEWDAGCVGCSLLADSITHLEHLHARDTSFVFVSRAPLATLQAYARRMGWDTPWYSSYESDFNHDLGGSTPAGETSLLSTFLRSGDDVFLCYQTTGRGVDRLNLVFNLLDLTPYGRQESWESSPPGWPQTEPYVWWRRHDEY